MIIHDFEKRTKTEKISDKIEIFYFSGAILLSLYYLFLWDPYKNSGHPPTQVPRAQSNSPATPTPSTLTTPSLPNYSTLSDSALDTLVEDLNNGVEPRTLALAFQNSKTFNKFMSKSKFDLSANF